MSTSIKLSVTVTGRTPLLGGITITSSKRLLDPECPAIQNATQNVPKHNLLAFGLQLRAVVFGGEEQLARFSNMTQRILFDPTKHPYNHNPTADPPPWRQTPAAKIVQGPENAAPGLFEGRCGQAAEQKQVGATGG